MSLDRTHLELLAALTEQNTLAAASAQINLSPSAASRRLQDAERRLGLSLVELHGRTLQLTTAGQLLADSAHDLLHQLAEAELAARWLGSGEEAPVRLGVGFYDQLTWALPPREVASFEVVRSPTARASDVLSRRRVDVAIDVAGAGHHDGRVLLDDRLILVVANTHRLASRSAVGAADLADERYFASNPNPLPGFEFERLFMPSGHSPRVIVRVESFGTTLDLIARGEGVSIQPRQALRGLRRTDLRPIELDREIPVQWVGLVGDSRTAPAMHALDLIAATAGASVADQRRR